MDFDLVNDAEKISDNYQNFFVNVFCCGHNFWDLILISQSEVTKNKDYYEVVHPVLRWFWVLYEGMTPEIAVKIREHINTNCKSDNEKDKYNIVLCKLDENVEELSQLLSSELSMVSPSHFFPIVVFVVNGDETQITIRDYIKKKGIKVDIRNIFMVKSPKNNPNDLYRRLFKICCYYNQLGDDFGFPLQLSKEEKIFHHVNTHYLFTLNIMLIGSIGTGKSTFANQLMGEKRSLELKGTGITKHITQYKLEEYPIALYDTPGFQNVEERDNIFKAITAFRTDLKSNKQEIHLILFFINGSGRAYKGEEVEFIQRLTQLSTPIWFLINFCDSDKKCSDRQSSVENDLKTKMAIKNPKVLPINIRPPIKGYKKLFEEMYDLYKNISDNADKINGITIEKKVGFVIGAALRVGHFLEKITSREIVNYFLLASMTMIDYSNDSKIKMVKHICAYYLIEKSEEECEQLIESFNWTVTIKEFAKEIDLKKSDGLALDVHWVYKMVTSIDKTDMINEKIFRYIYLKAIPYLAQFIKEKPLSFQIMTLNVLSLCIVSCKTLSYCYTNATKAIDFEGLIKEDMSLSVQSLKTISELPKYQEVINK